MGEEVALSALATRLTFRIILWHSYMQRAQIALLAALQELGAGIKLLQGGEEENCSAKKLPSRKLFCGAILFLAGGAGLHRKRVWPIIGARL